MTKNPATALTDPQSTLAMYPGLRGPAAKPAYTELSLNAQSSTHAPAAPIKMTAIGQDTTPKLDTRQC